ncbi:MAG: hypothetical protein AAF705_14700, partial [Bacteroidota bacterium]
NTSQVGALFSCESITQLTQTFEWSGTKSSSLQSMMRSIAREDLNSGFELQIVSELAKRPWRQNTIKELEAEFQVIKGQFKADIILEGEARRRMACELAKYLHRDYLSNFDQQSIFSPDSVPFKFYSYVRQNNLWRNLDNDITSLEETTEVPPSSNPALFDENERESLVQPKKTNNLNLINILYWTFLVACGWVLLSLILGTFLKNQRFRNPVTQQIFEILLLPFQLIKPLLTEKPNPKNTFYGLEKQAYGTPLSEDKIKTLIDSRIAERDTQAEPNVTSEESQDRLSAIETQLAWLQKSQTTNQTSEPDTPQAKSDQQVAKLIEELQLRLDALSKKVDQLNTKLETQTPQMPSNPSNELSVNNLSQVRQIVTQELSDFNLEIEKRIKALELKNTGILPPTLPKNPPVELETESPGLSVESMDPPLEVEMPEISEPDDQPEESIAPAEQLELNPIPNTLMPQFIYYASSPQRGVFYGRRLENGFIPKQTVYKIIIDKENPEQASFTLVTDEATIRLALNILDSYILPAMELRGPGKIADATDIGPVEPGLLQKEGDNWRIVKKGVLHYH